MLIKRAITAAFLILFSHQLAFSMSACLGEAVLPHTRRLMALPRYGEILRPRDIYREFQHGKFPSGFFLNVTELNLTGQNFSKNSDMWLALAASQELHALQHMSISDSKNPNSFITQFFKNQTLCSLTSFGMDHITGINLAAASKALRSINPIPFFIRDSQAYSLLHGPILSIELDVSRRDAEKLVHYGLEGKPEERQVPVVYRKDPFGEVESLPLLFDIHKPYF